MRKRLVTIDLTGAWETWEIAVSDDTTDDDLIAGTAEFDFVELRDSGSGSQAVTKVTDV